MKKLLGIFFDYLFDWIYCFGEDFERIHIGPNVLKEAKIFAKKHNYSEDDALIVLVIRYLQTKYSKEMEEDPTYVTIDGLIDEHRGIF